MATLLGLVNSIQRKLREDATASVSTNTYSQLLGEFINEAKREVEDFWDWLHLRTTITITTVASTFKYTLTTMGDRGRILPDTLNGPPYVDVWNNTDDYALRLAPSSQWMTAQKLNASTNGPPLWFDINGQSGGDPQVDLHPTPGAVYLINFNICLPQADFIVSTTANDTTELTVPDAPVVLRATALAKEERGEDPLKYQDQYETALFDLATMERAMTQGGQQRGQLLDG